MGQRLYALLYMFTAALMLGCGDTVPSPTTARSASAAAAPARIVALTPAGTNLMVAMGLKAQIVGVSAYETDPDLRDKLPKVGDYQRIDWEQLTQLKPTHLIVQGKRDRLPPGIEERCKELNIQVEILQIDRLEDIFSAINQLGTALGVADPGKRVVADLRANMLASDKRPVSALVLVGDEGKLVVGTQNFIDDVLMLAGAKNAAQAAGYVALDVEKGRALSPDIVFVLAPKRATTDIDPLKLLIASDDWPAVKNRRVYVINDDDALLPGACVTKLYAAFAKQIKDLPSPAK